MIAELCVGKDKKKTPELPAPPVPGGSEVDDAEYTEHLLVPVAFKERLEKIAQRVNQERRRQKLAKRPLGWFVVYYLNPVLQQVEAEQKPAGSA